MPGQSRHFNRTTAGPENIGVGHHLQVVVNSLEIGINPMVRELDTSMMLEKTEHNDIVMRRENRME